MSFVNELISRRSTFFHRKEHLSSVTKLAERMVVRVNDMAEQIRDEAIERAHAEPKEVLTGEVSNT